MTRTWIRKVTAWMLAFIFYKPDAAAVYATAFTMSGSGRGVRTVVMGFVMLLLSVLTLPALMKFFTWTTGSLAGSGGSGQLLGAAAVGAVAIGSMRSSPASGAQGQAAFTNSRLGPRPAGSSSEAASRGAEQSAGGCPDPGGSGGPGPAGSGPPSALQARQRRVEPPPCRPVEVLRRRHRARCGDRRPGWIRLGRPAVSTWRPTTTAQRESRPLRRRVRFRWITGVRGDGNGDQPRHTLPGPHLRRVAAQPQHRPARPRPDGHLRPARRFTVLLLVAAVSLKSAAVRGTSRGPGRRSGPDPVGGIPTRPSWRCSGCAGGAAHRWSHELPGRVVLQHTGVLQLPGALAATELLSAEDGYRRPLRAGPRPPHGLLTATLRVVPASTWLADTGDADGWVANWGAWLASRGYLRSAPGAVTPRTCA